MLVNVDESRNGRLMEYFRVKDFEAPLVRMINMTDQVTFQLPSDYPDEETVKQFCQSYLDGKAKVTLSTVFTWLWNVIDDNAHNNMNVLWVWVEQMAPLHVVFPLTSFFILFLTIELFIKKKRKKRKAKHRFALPSCGRCEEVWF